MLSKQCKLGSRNLRRVLPYGLKFSVTKFCVIGWGSFPRMRASKRCIFPKSGYFAAIGSASSRPECRASQWQLAAFWTWKVFRRLRSERLSPTLFITDILPAISWTFAPSISVRPARTLTADRHIHANVHLHEKFQKKILKTSKIKNVAGKNDYEC